MSDSALSEITWQARLADADPTLRVHLAGIGGAGLRAIASVLLELGVQVSGSDRAENDATRALADQGARVFFGQSAENLDAHALPDVVLISSAVQPENPEVQAAMQYNLPVVKRAEFLPALLARRTLIAIAGTHGKSTTTAMTVKALREHGIACGYIIGTSVPIYGSGSAGTSEYFVIEADEYDHMFLGLEPTVAVITNVEWDHPDCYPTAASYKRAFMQFVDLAPREGVVISCVDDAGAEQVRTYSYTRGPQWITYGLAADAQVHARLDPSTPEGDLRATVFDGVREVGVISMGVPGVHNLRNALAAATAAHWCGVPWQDALASIGGYSGAARRLEKKWDMGGVTIYDDYAHYPTEIVATLAALRQRYPARRIWAVAQPHTYSRTRLVASEMAHSFGSADEVILVDIYAAREQDDGTISSADIVNASRHKAIRYIGDLRATADYVAEHIQAGDVLITLGAGDSDTVGEMVMHVLRDRAAHAERDAS